MGWEFKRVRLLVERSKDETKINLLSYLKPLEKFPYYSNRRHHVFTHAFVSVSETAKINNFYLYSGTFQTNASGGYKIELVPPKLKLVKKIEWISFFHKKFKTCRKIGSRPENCTTAGG